MGQHFLFVNLRKRQFLNPVRFAGEGAKAGALLHGSHALAIAVLTTDFDHVKHDFGPVAGAWSGDRIVIAGDQAEPNADGIETATAADPMRNLYGLAYLEFEDVTHRALATLCTAREGFAAEIAARADRDSGSLVDAGMTVDDVGCEALEKALAERIGPNWRQRYWTARRTLGQ